VYPRALRLQLKSRKWTCTEVEEFHIGHTVPPPLSTQLATTLVAAVF
jgi:hypothetical protein